MQTVNTIQGHNSSGADGVIKLWTPGVPRHLPSINVWLVNYCQAKWILISAGG